MTLLAPLALWLSAIGVAVIGLYLLKIRRRRAVVPALDFWLQLAGPTHARSLFRQIKRWLSLLLWLLIVACLVLALGNPILSFGRIKPRSIVIILDNSASMRTIESTKEEGEPPRTRWDLALAAVDELTTRRPVSDEWMLIDASRSPHVRQAWTREGRAIRGAAEKITPHWGGSDLTAAKELAVQLLDGRDLPTIVVVSDGANGVVAALESSTDSLIHWTVGETSDNLGITRLSVRTHREDAVHYAFVRVTNASAQQIETQVVFEVDGSTTSVEPLTIEPGGTWQKTVALPNPEGGVLRVWIDRPDALQIDNEAFAILEPIKPASVFLVTPHDQAFFFQQALLAMDPLVDPDRSLTLTIEEYDALHADRASPDLILFNNCVPESLAERGSFIFINAWPGLVPSRSLGMLDSPELLITDRTHPLTRHVSLGGVTLARAKRIEFAEAATVIAESADGAPLIVLHQLPDRRFLCLAFDVMESNMPFRNAFPMLLRNAITYFVADAKAWIADQYEIGQAIRPLRRLPDAVTQITVAKAQDEDAIESRVRSHDGVFTFEDTDRPGPLRFTIGDETAYTAVNLASEAESRIAPTSVSQSPDQRLALTGRLLGTTPWLALAILGCSLIGVEWLTYHLRWTE